MPTVPEAAETLFVTATSGMAACKCTGRKEQQESIGLLGSTTADAGMVPNPAVMLQASMQAQQLSCTAALSTAAPAKMTGGLRASLHCTAGDFKYASNAQAGLFARLNPSPVWALW